MRTCIRAAMIFCALTAAARADQDDWPWWRGPNQNGSAAPGPALADAWGPNGPKLLWKSEALLGGFNGGMGSVTVADGRAYVYANWTEKVVTPARKVTDVVLDRLGRLPKGMPAALVQAVEDARVSDEYAALKPPQARAWAANWMEQKLTAERRTEFGEEIKARLAQGPAGLSPDQLKKLGTIIEREFAGVEDLKKWLTDNGFADPAAGKVVSALPTGLTVGRDTVLCMDAATGKTIWRKDYPGWTHSYAASATVAIAGGRAYVAGSYRSLYCLDAVTGKLLWSTMTMEQPNRINSSVLVVEGLAIVLGDRLTAYNIDTGEEVWRDNKITGNSNSPVLWTKDGWNYVLANSASEGSGPAKVFCLESKTGKVFWTVGGGSYSTVALAGDVMVVMSGGLTAYQLNGEQPPTKLWTAQGGDRAASPVICGGLVFAIGNGRTVCVDLKTGRTAWTEKAPAGSSIASPSAADGKVFYNAQEGRSFIMFQATADKYALLAETKTLGVAPCSSPTVVGGKMYLRLKDGVGCFDLAAPAAETAPASKTE